MDINNNQQINTFTKGMDTDTSDMYIGEGSYRYAENLRVVTDKDSNSGELHLIEGTNVIFNSLSNGAQLLGFTSIRNYLIWIINRVGRTNEGEVVNHWSIVRLAVNKDGSISDRVTVAGPFSEQIWPDNWDGITKPLSLVTRWESSENIKLYIASESTEILSINIAPDHELANKSFDEVFSSEKMSLKPITALVTDQKGATIPGVTIQYAYIVYKVNGYGTSLSPLSNVVVETVDDSHGYKADVSGEYAIRLTLPKDVLDRYVRIYRVAYPKSGQLPRVDLIFDQECKVSSVYDNGQSLENISSAEFIATNKLLFIPKEIESKGDYLFAANVKYRQDEIDARFDKFDARCYSFGNYYVENENTVWIRNNATDDILVLLRDKSIDLRHMQFESGRGNVGTYDPTQWLQNAEGYNGKGLCFSWKYVFKKHKLTYQNQYMGEETPRTYARNEVYRFGVRLFDEDGNASSVKWIADIKMPDYQDNYFDMQNTDEDGISVHSLSIEFTPRNIDSEYWDGVAGYEIVQARRSIADSYKVTQGIIGYPMDAKDNELCLPYFLSTQQARIAQGMWYKPTDTGDTLLPDGGVEYSLYRDLLLFASPEYVYQPDDIKSILSESGSTFYCKEVAVLRRGTHQYYDQDSDRTILTYEGTDEGVRRTNLTDNEMDLRIQYKQVDGHVETFLDQFVMSAYNQSEQSKQYPLIKPGNGKKNVYFTNMMGQYDSGNVESGEDQIDSIVYVNALDVDQFASNELPSYKNNFVTVGNKKFFNWTNPAMFHYYKYFTESGEDRIVESWKEVTMTSYDADKLEWKYSPIHIDNDTWNYDSENGVVGSSVFTFPTSAGGPLMILQLKSQHVSDTNNGSTVPPITIANIYRNANPYGGYNTNSINSTQYISGGCFKLKDEGPVLVSMGDNYITMFIYFLYHSMDNAQHNDIPTAAILYIVPIESTMDLSKQCSNYLQAVSKDPNLGITKIGGTGGNGIWVLANPGSLSGRFNQTTDMYMYNTAYSVLPDVITYAGQDTVNISDSLYDSRIHYSQKKNNNELIDSWTSFKPIDYLDVDSRYGQITGLKLFKDKLIFLQENGAGVLSVNDRIILKDQESANIIVGNGGVLDRYDYFTTIYGMKPNLHVVETTNDALYWWDGHRREILAYTDGYNVTLLLRIKNVLNYINNGEESTTPSIVCDANNKEVLFNVVNNLCLVYNEQIQQFTSVYTFNPIYYCNIAGRIFLTDEWARRAHIYEYNVYNLNEDGPKLFSYEIKPKLKYVVNKDPIYNKVFDIQTFGGRFYGGSAVQTENDTNNYLVKGEHNNNPLTALTFTYNTPTKQQSTANGSQVTNREYDYRLAIPRNHNDMWGGRMRGKTMECEITSTSNDKDFSIQYVTTKYRMSWT